MKHTTKRKLIQLYAALLYNANLKGFVKGELYTGKGKYLCAPGLNCYSCPAAVTACPLGALQNALASSGKTAPSYIFGILLLTGLLLGRSVCAYLCPFGLIEELLHKIPSPKIKKSKLTRCLSWMKYMILIYFVLLIPIWYGLRENLPIPGFCKYICPVGILEGAIPLLSHPKNTSKLSMLSGLFTLKFVIFILIITLCIFCYRAFCRFLCPLGAIYGLLNRYCLCGMTVLPEKCTACGRCISHCQMDVKKIGDHECIQCGDCIKVCPHQAIERKRSFPKLEKYSLPLLSGLLLFTLLWVNTRKEPALSPPADAIYGSKVGEYCKPFSAPLYGSDDHFVLEDAYGHVTVLNFWATWCGPCCKELPYFQQLKDFYGDEISVLAIHANLVTDDVADYLSDYDYTMPFALDETGDILNSLGGSMMLPVTVILDESGRIIYNEAGSMTYEKLDELVAPLINKFN